MKNPTQCDLTDSVGFFSSRWKSQGGDMHPAFLGATEGSIRARAETAAKGWYLFSDFMPLLLSLAMYRVSSNAVRAQIVDVLRDELGRLPNETIHSQMFAAALAKAGIVPISSDLPRITSLLDRLHDSIRSCSNDGQILGILLGLEIMANENIECLIRALSISLEARLTLEKTEFFRIHRANEDEHIANGIHNFRQFGVLQSDSFTTGFDQGVCFWIEFWNELGLASTGDAK